MPLSLVIGDITDVYCDAIVNCTNEYYDWLKGWFATNYDISISFNNTRNVIWSNDFSISK